MGVNSWPKTVTRQRRECDLNPGLLRHSTTEPSIMHMHKACRSFSCCIIVSITFGQHVVDNTKTWTGLPVEESIRMTENRDKWRKYVHGVANPRIEDG